MEKTWRANLWKLYADRFFASFWIVVPLLVPFYTQNGLNATQIYSIQAVYSAAVLVLDIPTGYLSDWIGRRRTLLLGAFLLPLGMTVYALAHSYWPIVIAEVLVAVGNSLRSGADTSFLYETLEQLEESETYKKHEGRGHFLERTGSAAASLLSGLATFIGIRAMFWVNVATTFVLFPLSWAMKEPPLALKKQPSKKVGAHVKALGDALRHVYRDPSLRMMALYAATLFSVSMASLWSYYLLFAQMELSLVWYGPIMAFLDFIGGVGGQRAFAIERRLGTRLAFALPIMIGPALLGLALCPTMYAVPVIFLCSFLRGLSEPLIRHFIQRRADPEERATTLSIFSASGRLAYILLAFPAGYIVDHGSIALALAFLAVVTVLGVSCALRGLRSFLGAAQENRPISETPD